MTGGGLLIKNGAKACFLNSCCEDLHVAGFGNLLLFAILFKDPAHHPSIASTWWQLPTSCYPPAQCLRAALWVFTYGRSLGENYPWSLRGIFAGISILSFLHGPAPLLHAALVLFSTYFFESRIVENIWTRSGWTGALIVSKRALVEVRQSGGIATGSAKACWHETLFCTVWLLAFFIITFTNVLPTSAGGP